MKNDNEQKKSKQLDLTAIEVLFEAEKGTQIDGFSLAAFSNQLSMSNPVTNNCNADNCVKEGHHTNIIACGMHL
jgi:hypothetical protein